MTTTQTLLVTDSFHRSYPNCDVVTLRTNCMALPARDGFCRMPDPEPDDITITVYDDIVDVGLWSDRRYSWSVLRRDSEYGNLKAGAIAGMTTGGNGYAGYRMVAELALWFSEAFRNA